MLTKSELKKLEEKENLQGLPGGNIVKSRLQAIEAQLAEGSMNEWDEYSRWTGDHHVWPRHTKDD